MTFSKDGEIESFKVRGSEIYFKTPLKVESDKGEELGGERIYIFSVINSKVLNLWEPARTLDEGITGIKEQLTMLWKDYVEEYDGLLTEDGLQLKRDFLALLVDDGGTAKAGAEKEGIPYHEESV